MSSQCLHSHACCPHRGPVLRAGAASSPGAHRLPHIFSSLAVGPAGWRVRPQARAEIPLFLDGERYLQGRLHSLCLCCGPCGRYQGRESCPQTLPPSGELPCPQTRGSWTCQGQHPSVAEPDCGPALEGDRAPPPSAPWSPVGGHLPPLGAWTHTRCGLAARAGQDPEDYVWVLRSTETDIRSGLGLQGPQGSPRIWASGARRRTSCGCGTEASPALGVGQRLSSFPPCGGLSTGLPTIPWRASSQRAGDRVTVRWGHTPVGPAVPEGRPSR